MTSESGPRVAAAFSMYAVFTRIQPVSDLVATNTDAQIARLAGRQVMVRGLYDVAAMPASADVLVWLHAPAADNLQSAVRSFEREAFGGAAELVWSAMGVHEQPEAGDDRPSAFPASVQPKYWLTVCPFARSHEWHLLAEDQRRALLAEQELASRDDPRVLSSTVAAFGPGEYEWITSLEADEPVHIVERLRQARSSGLQRFVRHDGPFFTGHRISTQELARVLR